MHMMSDQVMSNNIGMTQFRSTAITNFSNSRGINIPQNMQQQQQMQQSFIERKADFNNLLDTEADLMLKCKKITRKNLF